MTIQKNVESILNLIAILYIQNFSIGDEDYNRCGWKVYELLKDSITGLLEDLNYEVNKLSDEQLVIVEKALSAVAETNKNEIDELKKEYKKCFARLIFTNKCYIVLNIGNENKQMWFPLYI